MRNLVKRHLTSFIKPAKADHLKNCISKTKSNLVIGSLSILINLGIFSGVAQATTRQVILNISSTSIRSFSELLAQAEILASLEISQRFQNDPSLTEIQVLVLGERSGQIVSILSSQLTREIWESSTDLRPWTTYFTPASVLLGYTPSQVDRRQRPNTNNSSIANNSSGSGLPAAGTTSIPNNEISLYPREEVGNAMINGEISVGEYWDILDALD